MGNKERDGSVMADEKKEEFTETAEKRDIESSKKAFGNFGEDRAVKYLVKNGYMILDRNFRCRFGEIDIIALDSESGEIVFVEVKSRKSVEYGLPCEAVNEKKQEHILKSAETYISYKRLKGKKCRIDVIEILLIENEVYLRQLKNVF